MIKLVHWINALYIAICMYVRKYKNRQTYDMDIYLMEKKTKFIGTILKELEF